VRVLVTQPIYPESILSLRDAGFDVDDRRSPEPLGGAALVQACAGVHGVVTQLTDQVTADVFSANPQLEVVANAAVGYDNIDVAAAAAAGVTVTNTPGVLTDATADLALALLLAVARRIPEGDDLIRRGAFDRWRLVQHPMGMDVAGRTLGVVGMGRIGQAVAQRAHLGFGMPIVYTSRSPVPRVEERLGARPVGLPELLETSDYVTLHAPLTPESRHLIDAEALRRMKPTAVLVNTARGPLVDERALARALEDGEIAGAGLDVFEFEPQVVADLLRLRERVVLTPHVGSATEATRRRMSDMAVSNVIAVLTGKPAPHPVR
jgi:glyoxylate reductase